MPDEPPVAPALTPEEWANVESGRAYSHDARILCGPVPEGQRLEAIWHAVRCIERTQYRPGAVVALANAALRDGDPRKITREDVDDLLLMTKPEGGSTTFHEAQAAIRRLRALAAKLAALLPSETL